MRSFDSISDSILEPHPATRILIFDQTVIRTNLAQIEDLCTKFAQDLLVFTGENLSVSSTVLMMKAGAGWVFSKDSDGKLAVPDFAAVVNSADKLNQQVAEHWQLQALMKEISPREKSVLELVLNGIPNKHIAKQLEVSVRTVESRRAKIYRKCDVRTVTELVRRVDQAELLRKRFAECKRSPTPNMNTETDSDNSVESV